MKDKKPFNETKIGKFLKEKVKPVAGDVLEFVGDVTGIEAIDKVGEFLNKKKEESADLMNLHLEFERMRGTFENEMFRLQIQDMDSARSREVEFVKSTGKRDTMMAIIGIVWTVATMVFVAGLFFKVIPEVNKDILYFTGGTLVTGGVQILNYYYGTSAGSRDKSRAIESKFR